jgi:hypothetical protein
MGTGTTLLWASEKVMMSPFGGVRVIGAVRNGRYRKEIE